MLLALIWIMAASEFSSLNFNIACQQSVKIVISNCNGTITGRHQMRPRHCLYQMRPRHCLYQIRPRHCLYQMRPRHCLYQMRPRHCLYQMRPRHYLYQLLDFLLFCFSVYFQLSKILYRIFTSTYFKYINIKVME